jgi:hypothetical protein
MTDKEMLCKKGINLYLFDNNIWNRNGIYIKEINTIFINRELSDKEIHKVLLHELGHIDHLPSIYEIAKIRCENEANRNMIHHLVKDAVSSLEDVHDFNYLNFMKYHNLKTVTDEIMVMEEYYGLVAGL